MEVNIPTFTWICLCIIATCFAVCLALVGRFRHSNKLIANRRLVEYFPTLISSLGVLGTFLGITMGLLAFESTNLDQSIPDLLDGLKTAFFTSLAGMAGSMILSAFISRKQDEKDGGISDINIAAREITKAVKAMSDANMETMQAIQKQLAEQGSERKAFYQTAGDVLNSLVILQRNQEGTLATMKETSLSIALSMGSLEETTAKQAVSVSSMERHSQEMCEYIHHLSEILDILSSMSGTQDEINATVGKMQTIIHGEVIQIEESMEKSNLMLERKFDEFTDLLKKSNTEALVEVMQNVTAEFQKQMNELIGRLVQENFEQLNKSVEKLNQWQQENKEMIESLTRQYKEMSDNFESTSSSLSKVKEDTTLLVSEGGKLQRLIQALNQVVLEEQRFMEITKELQEAAALSKSNMESFDESTKALNEWVRKQRNFVDQVKVLIVRLEELDKIRDYGEEFWKGTKTKMEEGVNIISRGSMTLNSQLTSLDRQFYGRLNATLAELDNCITKMVEQIGIRR